MLFDWKHFETLFNQILQSVKANRARSRLWIFGKLKAHVSLRRFLPKVCVRAANLMCAYLPFDWLQSEMVRKHLPYFLVDVPCGMFLQCFATKIDSVWKNSYIHCKRNVFVINIGNNKKYLLRGFVYPVRIFNLVRQKLFSMRVKLVESILVLYRKGSRMHTNNDALCKQFWAAMLVYAS